MYVWKADYVDFNNAKQTSSGSFAILR
jgi:hypothetical protein